MKLRIEALNTFFISSGATVLSLGIVLFLAPNKI